jgi:hypothetical protein
MEPRTAENPDFGCPTAAGAGLHSRRTLNPSPSRTPTTGSRFHPSGVAAMRKLLMSLATVLFMAGLVIAAEVSIVKYDKDKKEVTVEEGGKEVVYKVSEKVKVTIVDKDGNKTEGKAENFFKRLENIEKSKNKKMDITVKDKEITEVQYRGGKKN